MARLENDLKALRKTAGLTQADLANKVLVSRKTINTIENNIFVPSTVLSLKIAKALNVTVHDVFRLEEDV